MRAPVICLSRLLSRVRASTAAAAAACLAIALTGAGTAEASPAATAPGSLTVQAAGMTVQVAPAGGISSVTFADGRTWQLGGRSLLTPGTDPGTADQCTPAGSASATADGGAQWQTTCTDSAGHTTTVTEQLAPADGSVSWSVQARSQGGTYAQGIWTKLTGWTDSYTRQFWTTWGQSPGAPRGHNPTWTDPLAPAPFTNMSLPYGTPAQYAVGGFSVPVFTIVEPGTDHSLSLVQSPADTLIRAAVTTDASGDVQFGRFNNRLAPGQPVTFHMNLVPSAADWRGGLGWMTSHYPSYFQPAMPTLDTELSGLGSYSGYPGPLGPSLRRTLDAQDYQTNWELSLHGPYMGEFLPPVKSASEQFPSFYHPYLTAPPATTSVGELRQLANHYNDAGFHELGYFNTTEFGTAIQYPQPPQARQCSDPQVWLNANDYLYCDFPNAMIRDSSGNPTFSWENAVVMDPGDPSYRQHLLDQAQRLLTSVPYSGIAIDRLDWVGHVFNIHADDGVTWNNGAPARALVTSWKQLMAQLAPMVHNMGKVVWANAVEKRLDLMKGVDGFFTETDTGDAGTNADAFLALDKPAIGWNYDLNQNTPATGPADGPDGLIQRFLYMGEYPMSDSPANDHGLTPPSPFYEQYYRDYAAMFNAMHGRQWDLTPHAVTVTGSTGDTPLANVFTVPDGVVVPVVQGGTSSHATVTLRGLHQSAPAADLSQAEYAQPGSGQWRQLPVTQGPGGMVQADVPLAHGAAMIRFLSHPAENGATSAPGRPVTMNLSSSSQWASQAQPATVTATVHNTTGHTVTGGTATLTQPTGWTVSQLSGAPADLASGQSATVGWQVTAPPNATGTVEELTATASYDDQGAAPPAEDTQRLAAGTPVPQGQITATATSAQADSPASNAIDGDATTIWQPDNGAPQSITLDLGTPRNLSGLTYVPRQDGQMNGLTMSYQVSVSSDGGTYTPVSAGDWPYDTGLRAATFNARGVRYLRLETLRGSGGQAGASGLVSAAEINAIQAPPGPAQGPVVSPLTPGTIQTGPGGSTTVSTTITNPGSDPASNVSAELHAPSGWTVTPVQAPASIPGGQTVPASWKLTAPAGATPAVDQVSATIGYDADSMHWATTTATNPVYLGIVPQNRMSASATSYQPGNDPGNAIDGNPITLWHTEWAPVQAYPPQSITLNLGGAYDVTGLRYLPRQDGFPNGIITSYNIYVSQDGTNFTKISNGSWPLDATEKTATFTAGNIHYLRLEGVQAGANFVSAAEINILGTPAS